MSELRTAVMVCVSDPYLTWPEARQKLTDALNRDLAAEVVSPQPMSVTIGELRAGEDGDGARESTDLYVTGRGVKLLVNVPLGSHVTYSMSVDGEPHRSGIVGAEVVSQPPQEE